MCVEKNLNKTSFKQTCFLFLQDSGIGTPVTLRVDAKGFYLNWIDQNHEMDMLDISTIRDVRTGQYAKKPRVSDSLLINSNTVPGLKKVHGSKSSQKR